MPSAAFIAAASAANRQPVALLAIESIDALKQSITTQPDWQASPSLVNINTAIEPGRVFMATDGVEPYYGIYPVPTIDPLMAEQTTESGAVSLSVGTIGFAMVFRIRFASQSDFLVFYNLGGLPVTLMARLNNGAWYNFEYRNMPVTPDFFNPGNNWTHDYSFTPSAAMVRGAWDFKIKPSTFWAGTWIKIVSYTSQHETRFLPSGSLTTKTLDLGLIPTLASRLEIDDLVPPGATMVYAAWGSNNATAWTSLGVVLDGTALAAYRYYYFTVALTSGGLETPYLDELRVVGGNSQYNYFSTHKDTPIQGAKPYIAPGGVSSISSKVDLTQPATVGELTIKLHWRKEVGDMIATGYLKNKTIICKIGFVGLAEQDYEPYFVGTWYDYQADPEKGIITVKTRNILKKFQRKVPAAEYFLDAQGAAFVPPKLFHIGGNIMSAMLTLADLLGIPDRYLDRASFTAIAAGARSGVNWNVTRDLTAPQDAGELLNELAVSAGVFLVEGADGRLTAQLYDDVAGAAAVATLDAKHHKFRQIDGGQKELFTRQTIYYQLLPGKDGGSASDYARGLIQINAAAELAWSESAGKEWLDKWGLSPIAIQMLAQRRDAWFANPLSTVKVENIPPRYWGVKRGQVVAVDNLQLPCPSGSWQGYSAGTRFLVMSNTISDPTSENLTVSFDLLQIGAFTFTANPAFPVYTPLEFFPAVTSLALAERLVLLPGGSVATVLDVTFTQPLDFHYGGAAIWSRVNSGAWQYQGTLQFGGPVDTRLFTFAVVEGQAVDVAVLTINAAGQTMPLTGAPTVSRSILGKLAAPSNVTGFAAALTRGQLLISWNPITDIDRAGYELQIGTVWDAAGNTKLIKDFAGTSYPWTPTSSGNINLLIKALDTTGNYSVAAAALTYTIAPPGPVVNLLKKVIDNIVDLHWTAGQIGSFPIDYYELWKGDTFATAVLLGRKYGTFDLLSESLAGTYKYWVRAVDVAGLVSAETGVYTVVDQPPDYVLIDTQNISLPACTLTNAVLENGQIIMPCNPSITWQDHFQINPDTTLEPWSTPQDQINSGYALYGQPVPATALLERIVDYGAVIPQSKLTMGVTRLALAGTVVFTPEILWSLDGVTYTSLGNVYASAASAFRYIKYRLAATTVDGGIASIQQISVKLDVKQKTFVVNTVNVADTTGDGTQVLFSTLGIVPVDVVGITADAPYTGNTANDPIKALVNFVDAANPTSFKVLAWNKSGTRVAVNSVTVTIRYI